MPACGFAAQRLQEPRPIPMANPSSSKNDAALIERQRAALTKHQFRTNDLVQFSDYFFVQINGTPLLGLKSHDRTVLLILAQHAINMPGAPVATKEIVRAITDGNDWLARRGMSWSTPTAEEVHRAVCRVRGALWRKGLNPALIQSVAGPGYRLNTPAMNVTIDLIGSEKLARTRFKMLGKKDFASEVTGI